MAGSCHRLCAVLFVGVIVQEGFGSLFESDCVCVSCTSKELY